MILYKEKFNKELLTTEIINYLEEIYHDVNSENNHILCKENSKSTYYVVEDLHKNIMFKHVIEEILRHVDNYKKIYNLNQNLIIRKIWSNMTKKNGYTDIHSHKHINGISGVIYIEMHDDQMGNFFIVEDTIETEIVVRTGDIMIFPSTLVHGTKKNLSDFKRLILGFNIEII